MSFGILVQMCLSIHFYRWSDSRCRSKLSFSFFSFWIERKRGLPFVCSLPKYLRWLGLEPGARVGLSEGWQKLSHLSHHLSPLGVCMEGQLEPRASAGSQTQPLLAPGCMCPAGLDSHHIIAGKG